MSNRKILKHYIQNGGNDFICSPQIGAGAGFDAKLAGKEWLSEATIQDTIAASETFDMVPLYNFGLPDLTQLLCDIRYENKSYYDEKQGRRITEINFITPIGSLSSKMIEEKRKGSVMLEGLIKEEDELKILEYYLDALLEIKDYSIITQKIANIRKNIGEDRAMDIQWAMQPYELLCFPDTMNTAILAMEIPEKCKVLWDKILKLDELLLQAVAKGGADFVFLGAPGSEMISPRFYREYIVPYSKVVSEMAHQNGLLIYSHICSPIEPMLSMGFYNQMGLDLFETLSAPPVGNIKNLEDAFFKLDEGICTRGNIGLDVLLNASSAEITEQCLSILEIARKMNRKHILAASDYLFYDTKVENVKAMCEAVKEFR